METEDTKKCPFCAELIKVEAIKCRYCGEIVDTAIAAEIAVASRPTTETKTFVIPFPDGSPPRTVPFRMKPPQFTDAYLRAIGYKGSYQYRKYWQPGATITWKAFREYFVDRLNELGQEGWQLVGPFEQFDDDGLLVSSEGDRFEFEELESNKPERYVFVGAKFVMQRTTLG